MRDVAGEGWRKAAAVGSSTTRRSDDSRDVIVVTCFTSPLSIVSLLTPPPTAKCRPGAGSRPR